MKKQKWHFVSYRVFALGCCEVFLMAFLLIMLFVAFLRGESFLLIPIIIGCALNAVLMWVAYAWVLRPYRRMEDRMKLFLDGYTTSSVANSKESQLTPTSEMMTKKLEEIMNSAELLNINKRQAQYLALQNQINPHFLYNTLESIRSEALIAGLASVADMTEALASFFRYTISNVENLVSVEEEIQNCKTYFKIQQYRFGERLNLSIECNEDEKDEIYSYRLPKLTMQPILENSIIHGTECKIGTGHLKICLERTGKRLLIRISDDGVGMDAKTLADMNERLQKSAKAFSDKESETKGGIALVNVNNRIHLLFGEEYGLHVYSMPDVGTDVEITLPTITSDREITNENRNFANGTSNL
ncbi:MAG: sensor histidine kinase [Lachnospiraceae bacterium]|nr:sensor histidine kinase [Lachnospiraceae bacterium]